MGGRRKSVVSSISCIEPVRPNCVCLPRSRESLSVVVGTSSGTDVHRRSVLLPLRKSLVTVFPPLVGFHRRPPVLASPRVFGHACDCTCTRVRVCVCVCVCVCVYACVPPAPGTQKSDRQERKVRGQVLRYNEVRRGLSRVPWVGSRDRVQFFVRTHDFLLTVGWVIRRIIGIFPIIWILEILAMLLWINTRLCRMISCCWFDTTMEA